MDIVKTVELTEEGAFLLFRAIATEALINVGFKGDAWKETELFDLSFSDILDEPLENWEKIIINDAEEYKVSSPEDFD